jgi:hypothetical protein
LSPGKWQKSKACEVQGLADGAHSPVLQISKKQNRELPYASCAWGKPAKSLETL